MNHIDKLKAWRVARANPAAAQVDDTPGASKSYEDHLAAVRQNGMALRDVPGPLCTADLCLTAVQQDGRALGSVPIRVFEDERFSAYVAEHWDDLSKELGAAQAMMVSQLLLECLQPAEDEAPEAERWRD